MMSLAPKATVSGSSYASLAPGPTLVHCAALDFVWIEPGTFTMGSPSSESSHVPNEAPQHEVTIRRGFWLGKYEVTQGQWKTLMGADWGSDGGGSDYFRAGADYPALGTSHDDAVRFCRKLTDQERRAERLPSDWEYTLPTEAQWEYACRAGTKTRSSDMTTP